VEARRAKSLQQAYRARHLAIPASLSCVIGEDSLDGLAAKFYVDFMKVEFGKPTDPTERMMVEQMIFAHHRIAALHAKAASATTIEAIKVFNAAVVRLMGEFRRSALALKAYRQPPAQKSFSVVHQQNVVASGQQHVAYVAEGLGKETLVVRDEVSGNAADAVDERINGNGNLNQESPPGRSGPAKRSPAASLVS
jgi:hypothetical protein